MAKEMRCGDVGMDCDFVARAESTEELMEQVAAHAAEVHGHQRDQRRVGSKGAVGGPRHGLS